MDTTWCLQLFASIHSANRVIFVCLFFCHLCSSHAVSFSKFKAASAYSQFAEDRSWCSFKSGAGFAAIAFLILHSEHELWNKAKLPFSGIVTTQFSANTEEKVKSHRVTLSSICFPVIWPVRQVFYILIPMVPFNILTYPTMNWC